MSKGIFRLLNHGMSTSIRRRRLSGRLKVANLLRLEHLERRILLALPDLTVTAAQAPSSVILGQSVAVSWSVKDIGSVQASGTWYDAVYLGSSPTFDASTDYLLDSYDENGRSPLTAGSSYTDNESIFLPSNAPIGDDYLIFVANYYGVQGVASTGEALGESDYTNNTYAVPITVTAPDLTVTTASAPSSAILGKSVGVSYSVQNIGSVEAPLQWSDAVYLSSSPTVNASAFIVAEFGKGGQSPLGAGAGYTDNESITLPSYSPTGNEYLVFVVNFVAVGGNPRYPTAQGETDYANNAYAVPIKVMAPDLTVTTASAASSAIVGQSVGVSWSVQNIGSIETTGPWDDAVYLSSSPTFDASTDTFIAMFSEPNQSPLAAGASYTDNESISLPQNAPIGDDYLIFVANYFGVLDDFSFGGAQGETDYTNNTYAVPITVTAPDLTVTTASTSAPGSVTQGQSVGLSWSVQNIGSVETTGPWIDSVYLSSSPTFDASTDTYITSFSEGSRSPLAAGASYTDNESITLPSNAPIGDDYLIFVANIAAVLDNFSAGDALGETDYANNAYAVPIKVTDPDLTITTASAPSSVIVNGVASVSWTVENIGSVPAPGDWDDAVYIGSSPTFNSQTDSYITSFSESGRSPLAAGASYTDNESIVLPAVAATGGQYLIFVTNYQAVTQKAYTQSETNYLNNSYAVPILAANPIFAADNPTVAQAGESYSYQFKADGSSAITYSATGLPGWAQFDDSTGLLTGTPPTAGTFDFSVTASLGDGKSTSVAVSLVVAQPTGSRFDVAAGSSFTVPDNTYTEGTFFNVGAGATVTIDGGTFTGGAYFSLGAGAVVNIIDRPIFSGTLTGGGDGTVNLGNGRLFVGTGGLTLDFPGDMFQWTGGGMSLGNGDLTNLGTMTITAPVDFYNDGILDNFGTIIQTGQGNLQLGTDGYLPATLNNEAGGYYLLEGDGGLTEISDSGSAPGQVSLENAGVIRKADGIGISPLDVLGSITNTGTIEVDTGTIEISTALGISQVVGGVLTAGTWAALDGGTLVFPSGTKITSNQAQLKLGGAKATISGISDLAVNSGIFVVDDGSNFTTAADFTNSGSLTVGTGSTFTVSQNFSQTSAGSLIDEIGGSPSSGQYGTLKVSGSATLDGAFGLTLINDFSPSSGQTFDPITFGSKTGDFTSFAGLSPFFVESFGSSGLQIVDVGTNSVDLAATSVTAPTSANVGRSITVNWHATDQSSQATSGGWQDSVYLSTSPTISSSSILLGMVPQTSALGGGASYSTSLTATLPASLAPGYYYVLVDIDSLYKQADPDRSNNVLAASTGEISVGLPALTLGSPTLGSFSGSDEDNYYQITVPAGGSLAVSLQSSASSGGVGLYISQGTLPTPYNYQDASSSATSPDPTVTVPVILTAGTYFILAQGVSGAAATSGYTIMATQTAIVSVSSISPYSGGNAGNVTIEIDGANFSPSATASLTRGNTTIADSSVEFVNASQVYATFNLGGAAVGNYSLTVHQSAQSAKAPSTFQVVAASPNNLDVMLITPQYVRSGRTGTVVITYTNETQNDIVAPLLEINSTTNGVEFSTPDDPNNFVQAAQILAVAPSGPAGILRPGQSGQLTLTLLDDNTDGQDVPVQVSQISPGQTIDWSAQRSALQPPGVPSAAWDTIFSNLLATIGSTTDSYNAALAKAATYLSGLGETTAQVSDVGSLYSFLISQADAEFPTPTLTTATDASLSIPGSLSLSLDRSYLSSIEGRSTSGLFGLGWLTSWQSSLTVMSSGNVNINGAVMGYFADQPNGTYEGTDGAYGTLTRSGSVYTLTATSGTQYVFQAGGHLQYEQDVNGNRITLGYDGQGHLVSLTYSNPNEPSEPSEQLNLTYNSQGYISRVLDGTGDVWSYTYDSAGHLLSVTAPGPTSAGHTTNYTYDTGTNAETVNSLLSITNPNGSEEVFTYDSLGRISSIGANGGAGTIIYTYPDEAEIVGTDGSGDQTITWYNAIGQEARVQNALGGISIFLYDNNGNLVSYTNAVDATSQYTYNQVGEVTQTVDPLGRSEQMTYNSMGELTSLTDADDNTTQYSYGLTGNLLSITYPDGTQQSFTYDPLGDPTETIEQDGEAVSTQYNALGLIAQESFADGTYETFTYDVHGNILTAQTFASDGTSTGTTTLTYNDDTELTSVSYPDALSLTYTYNAAGQRTSSTDQSGYKINYAYDALGRLSDLTDGSGSLIVRYIYNDLGQLQKKINGNGTYTICTYDAADNLTSEINYSPTASVNSSFTYAYNVLDEMTSMTDASGNVTVYHYDTDGELTQVILPGGATVTYVYNADGDRTEVVNSGTPTSYASNDDNEITQAGADTYTYDANGNLATVTDINGTTTYAYNDQGQLISINGSDGSVTAFQYSPLGFMVGENVDGNQTNFLVSPTGAGTTVASYTGSGSLIADYNYGLGLVSQSGPSGVGFYDFDAAGNTIGITNAGGSYVDQYSYLPFGETSTKSASLPNPFQFGGEYGILTLPGGLDYMRARNYVVSTGQFASNDPLGLNGGDTNIRRYVSNNPTTFTDPTGQFIVSKFGIGITQILGGALGALGGGAIVVTTDGIGTVPGYIVFTEGIYGIVAGFENVSDAIEDNDIELPGGLAEGIGYLIGPNVQMIGKYADTMTSLIDVPFTELGDLLSKSAALPSLAQDFVQEVADLLKSLFPQVPTNPKGTGKTDTADPEDPNSLIGPAGYGSQGFIPSTGILPYTIDFENDGNAAAQDVTVTQQLDPSLDWSKFQLGSFGFGPVKVTVPAGLTQYETTISYQNSDGSSLNVQVSLDFDVMTGLLTVAFVSLDPLTGQAPLGIFDGFLPPENSSDVGEGYVQYTVQPKANLSTGIAINQQASIVFDVNGALVTNTATNTIDAGPPTSTVAPLPATTKTPDFTVSWSGSDGQGPGIASYDVYVSVNGGAFTLWQSDTSQTSATYDGQVGDTYGFYSVATDDLGLVQPTPTAAQASTTVSATAAAIATTTSLSASENPAKSGNPVTFTATVTPQSGNEAPTGSVQFLIDGTDFGSPVPLAAGKATSPAITTLTVGNHAVTADYINTDGLFTASTGTLSGGETVNSTTSLLTTQIILNPSLANPTYGQSLTFSVTVSAATAGQPTPTGTIQFLVDGADFGPVVTLVNGIATSQAIASLTAGAYTISAIYSGDSKFSSSTSPNLDVNVAKARLTVTANDAIKVYGQANPAFTASYSGFVLGQDASSLAGNLTFAATATAASHVGQYAITPGGLTSPNYSIAFDGGILTVTPAPLIVSAVDVTKPYDQPVPTLTATYSGLVNGDGPSNLTTPATLTTTATASSAIGSYPIIAGGASSPDYAITYVNGVLTVPPAITTSSPGWIAFVDTLFQVILNRTPDVPGLEYWLERLADGTTRAEVNREFYESLEYRTLKAEHKAPKINQKTSLADAIHADKLASVPPAALANPGHIALVTTLYHEILNRAPEPLGQQYWLEELAIGTTPATVALDIFNSPEHKTLQKQHKAPRVSERAALADALKAEKVAVRINTATPTGPMELA